MRSYMDFFNFKSLDQEVRNIRTYFSTIVLPNLEKIK